MGLGEQIKLFLAIRDKDLDGVKKLLPGYEIHANVRWGGREDETPLMTAASRNAPEIIEHLVANGGKVDAQNQDGWTALHYAVKHKSFHAMAKLLELDAQGTIACKRDEYDDGRMKDHKKEPSFYLGDTPLHLACRWYDGLELETILSTFANSASSGMDCENRHGRTPLQEMNNPAVVRQLLTNVTEIKTVYSAVREGNEKKLKEALKKKVKLNIPWGRHIYNELPLHVAARCDRPQIYRLLVEAGADPFEFSNDGLTALHCAVINNSIDTIVMALQLDPDLGSICALYTARDHVFGDTPLHLAAKLQRWDAAYHLLLTETDTGYDMRNANGDLPKDVDGVDTQVKLMGLKKDAEEEIRWRKTGIARPTANTKASDIKKFLES